MSNFSQSTTISRSRPVRVDQAFAVINQMVADDVIKCYALGGATAAFFYIEPDTTYDVDIFCVLETFQANAIDMLTPVYAYLATKGFEPKAEAVVIHGVAVQFLPVFNPLNEEAVETARELDYEGVPVGVMSPEHLVAIMLQTGRTKDLVRIARFAESDAIDRDTLSDILARHKLKQRWNALANNLEDIKRRLAKK